MEKKLNMGCGSDIRSGWINLDIASLEGVDVVHDINVLPLPFDDSNFDFVLCQDILEHLEYIPLLEEIHRITKPGGIVEIRVPHFSSRFNFIDPTHKKMFSIQTFDYFTKNAPFGRNYYFPFHFEKTVYRKICFSKSYVFFINYLIEPMINIGQRMRTFYEASFLARLFPAANIVVRLKK